MTEREQTPKRKQITQDGACMHREIVVPVIGFVTRNENNENREKQTVKLSQSCDACLGSVHSGT
jgi:hypothetical protein